MTDELASATTEICPTCGTRLPEGAARCLVCGSAVGSDNPSSGSASAVQGSRMPEITLSLPAALGLLALILGTGAILVFFALRSRPEVVAPITPSPTSTVTLTATASPTTEPPTRTPSPAPSPTPLSYEVQAGDTCAGIAFSFNVSVQSIVLLNNLPADCGTLLVDQTLLIPHPTPTVTPLPSATLSPAQATEEACETIDYDVEDNDTLSGIAANYNVSIAAIKEYNGLVSDSVLSGQRLVIPLCERLPTPGPTPTPTNPPPYNAPNLLLPADGAPFTLADDNVTLQWASVGTLLENEAYAVTIEDITEGEGRRLVDYVVDTKYIVPTTFRPQDASPHAIRWQVVTVRQVGTDDDGNPVYEPAGAPSATRVFIWSGAAPGATPTP